MLVTVISPKKMAGCLADGFIQWKEIEMRTFIEYTFMIALVGSFAILLASRLQLIDELEATREANVFVVPQLAGGGKITMQNRGDCQGFWTENKTCQMGLVTWLKNSNYPNFDYPTPFIQVWPCDKDGKIGMWPFCMNYQNGELQLQIPGKDSANCVVIPMSEVVMLVRDKYRRQIPQVEGEDGEPRPLTEEEFAEFQKSLKSMRPEVTD